MASLRSDERCERVAQALVVVVASLVPRLARASEAQNVIGALFQIVVALGLVGVIIGIVTWAVLTARDAENPKTIAVIAALSPFGIAWVAPEVLAPVFALLQWIGWVE